MVLARDLGRAPERRSTCAGRCAGWPSATRAAGPSPSTACSARRRRCWCAGRAAWSPPGCWPARIRRTGDDGPRPGPRRRAGRVEQGPRGARVRRALGRRRAGAALLVDRTCRRRRSCCTCPTSCTWPPTSPAVARGRRRPSLGAAGRAAPLGGRGRHADRRRRCGLIREIEGMDRGRYAGPVGWMDATGDGEWGIALRCAEIDPADPSGCGSSPAAASSPAPTRRPSWPRPRPSWCRCATPSLRLTRSRFQGVAVTPAVQGPNPPGSWARTWNS